MFVSSRRSQSRRPADPACRRAKLLLAFAGYVIGYDGHFEFENIGDSYIENKVPYIGLRVLSVLFGSLIPVVVFAIMRTSGYPRVVALVSASLVLFGQSFVPLPCSKLTQRPADNAHVVQTRLILLDAPLILFMAASFYCYIRFYKLRYRSAPSLQPRRIALIASMLQ